MNKIGTVTVSVYKEKYCTDFKIETDNEDILPVSYIIEDALRSY